MHKRNEYIATPKDEWETPPELFKKLADEFYFVLDAAATKKNTRCPLWFGKDGIVADALHPSLVWKHYTTTPIFLNPPYSPGMLELFMRRAYIESLRGAVVVCLVPFSGAGWFKRWCMNAYEIRIVGRVRFVGYTVDGTKVRNTPTFDSCIVVFDATKKKEYKRTKAAFDLPTPVLTVFT